MRDRPALASALLAGAVVFFCGPSIPAAPISETDLACIEVDPPNATCAERPIEEIIVTALRRETTLHDTPMAVSVLSGERLQQTGATNFIDYAHDVPGLSLNDLGLGGEKPAIRGVQSDTCCEVPATALYFDDVPISYDGTVGVEYPADPVLFDLDRVEVLRGPQGVHFGSGALGGALRVMPRHPDPDRRETFIETGVQATRGGGIGFSAGGVINRPLAGDRAAVRAAAFIRDDDGYIDNLALSERRVNDDRTELLRLSASFEPTPRVRLFGQVAWQNRESDGNNVDDRSTPDYTQFRQASEFNDDEWAVAHVSATVDLRWGTLVSSTAFFDRTFNTSFDSTPSTTLFLDFIDPDNDFSTHTVPTSGNTHNVQEQWSQEIRLVSGLDGRWQWLAGLYLSAGDFRFRQFELAPSFDTVTGGIFGVPDGILFRSDINTDHQQRAVFGDLTYTLGDRTDMAVGARWFEFDLDARYEDVEFDGFPFSSMGSTDESGVTPRISIHHRANEGLSVYGAIAEGFRLGGLNRPSDFTPECVDPILAAGFDELPLGFDSDELVSYEIGLRRRGPRWSLGVVAYHIDWDDIQSLRFIAEGDCVIGFVENAGNAVSDGLELEVEGTFDNGLEYRAVANLTDAELDEDSPNFDAAKGARLPGVPKLSGSVGLGRSFPGPFGTNAYLGGDVILVGSSYTTFSDFTKRKLDAYQLVNLRASFASDNWELNLFANNVFDERGLIIGYDFLPLGEWDIPTRPRTVGVSLRWSL